MYIILHESEPLCLWADDGRKTPATFTTKQDAATAIELLRTINSEALDHDALHVGTTTTLPRV